MGGGGGGGGGGGAGGWGGEGNFNCWLTLLLGPSATLISEIHKKDQKDSFFPPKIGQTPIKNKNFIRKYMQKHTMTEIVNHSGSTALEWSVKTLLGRLNRFYVAKTLALNSVVVTQLFSPREGCLTSKT